MRFLKARKALHRAFGSIDFDNSISCFIPPYSINDDFGDEKSNTILLRAPRTATWSTIYRTYTFKSVVPFAFKEKNHIGNYVKECDILCDTVPGQRKMDHAITEPKEA